MKVIHVRYIGPGIGLLSAMLNVTIVKAIALAKKRRGAIEFVFNGVGAKVCPNSDPEIISRKWKRDLKRISELRCLSEKKDGTFEVGICTILNAIDEAVTLAKKKKRVIKFKFNGVDVKVRPDSSPRSVCRKWEQDLEKRGQSYL